MFLWRSRIEVKILCPTRFVVHSMESSNKGGGVAEVCSSQTGLWFGTLLRDMYARIRTYYVRPNIFGENKKHPSEVRSRHGHTCRTCVQKFRSISYKTSSRYRILCGKHAYLGSCLYLLGSSVASGFCVMFHLKFTYYYREVKFCVKPFTDGHAVK